ncbi:hypothetical protein [Hymenobacter roseosalivarius]|uniref:hypothetical protein n=1 Tax=Hymenobacter roseosalivarius TaxID=89967 RepID=UPI00117AD59E|nr:hypothetical protein [Hymenobacter roseosalivarius]
MLVFLLITASAATAIAQRRQPANFLIPTTPLPPNDLTVRREGADNGTGGRYQLPDSTWHEALVYEIKRDRVHLGTVGTGVSRAYSPEQIIRFTADSEIYSALPQGFARELFNAGGYTLFDFQKSNNPSAFLGWTTQQLLLRVHTELPRRLPTGRRKFNKAMLAVVGDNPELARQLRSNKFRAWPDAADILTTYVLTQNGLSK